MNKEEFFWKFFLKYRLFFLTFWKIFKNTLWGSKWIFGGSSNLIPGFFWRKSAKIVEEILWYSKIIESECCEYSLKICDDRFLSFQSSSSENHLFAIIWYRISSDFTEINSFNSNKDDQSKMSDFSKKINFIFSYFLIFRWKKIKKNLWLLKKTLRRPLFETSQNYSEGCEYFLKKSCEFFWNSSKNLFRIRWWNQKKKSDEIIRNHQKKSSDENIRWKYQMKISDENSIWKIQWNISSKKFVKKRVFLFYPFFTLF